MNAQCMRCGGVDIAGHDCGRDVEPWHGKATTASEVDMLSICSAHFQRDPDCPACQHPIKNLA